MLTLQAVTICLCDGGVVAIHDGGPCLPEQGSLEEVTKRYGKDDIWFLEFVNVSSDVGLLGEIAFYPGDSRMSPYERTRSPLFV